MLYCNIQWNICSTTSRRDIVLSLDIYVDDVDPKEYFVVTYKLEGTDLNRAAFALAVGQSVGNPSVRNEYETPELIDQYSAKIIAHPDSLSGRQSGVVRIAFPYRIIDWETDGISQLLCVLMGGQMDIDYIHRCELINLEIDRELCDAVEPRYGLSGMRALTGNYNKPLLGSIVKPKTGLTGRALQEIVEAFVEGGVDFIKEDEIMSNPSCLPLKERIWLVQEVLRGTDVVYCYCINADPLHVLERAKTVAHRGGNGVHINFWSGHGVYKSINQLDLPLYIHYQKSGDKVLSSTKNAYRIAWPVLCLLASLSGVDTIHTGMWGGYLSDDENELRRTMHMLSSNNTVPALSCGMTAELIPEVTRRFGVDYLANVGGAIHEHPDGMAAGAKRLREAIDSSAQ